MVITEVKKTVKVYSWDGKEVPEGFYLCRPEVCYSSGRQYVYFTYADLRSNCWISATKLQEKPKDSDGFGRDAIEVTLKDGSKYYREVFPFSLWSIKSEASATQDHRARFLDVKKEEEYQAFIDYAYQEKWWEKVDEEVRELPHRLEYREKSGSYGRGYRPYYMSPTDWIIFEEDKIRVVKNEEYQKMQLEKSA